MLGAERVIAIDRVPERLALARSHGHAKVIDFGQNEQVYEQLQELTKGRGPDRCIDAVGAEAHGTGAIDAVIDRAKAAVHLGAYLGFPDKFPMGAFMNKALTMKSGQTHVQRYLRPLYDRIQAGEIDPSFIITHHLPLAQAPDGYRMFRDKKDGCIKVVLRP